MAHGVGKFPHISRNIPRTFVLFLVLVAFLAFLAFADGAKSQVAGASTDQNEELNEEINRTLSVIEARPDYAGAWVKLSVLYEQIGEPELASGAMETAKELNPNF